MIIVLDDARTFPFGEHYRDSETVLMRLKLEHALRNYVDELWLDHDLGGDDDAIPVGLWLAEVAFTGAPLDVGMIYVHSMNPVGADWLMSTLTTWYPTSRVMPPSHV